MIIIDFHILGRGFPGILSIPRISFQGLTPLISKEFGFWVRIQAVFLLFYEMGQEFFTLSGLFLRRYFVNKIILFIFHFGVWIHRTETQIYPVQKTIHGFLKIFKTKLFQVRSSHITQNISIDSRFRVPWSHKSQPLFALHQ